MESNAVIVHFPFTNNEHLNLHKKWVRLGVSAVLQLLDGDVFNGFHLAEPVLSGLDWANWPMETPEPATLPG